MALGFYQVRTGLNNGSGRGHMLQHFQAGDDIEVLGVFLRQLFSSGLTVVYVDARFLLMDSCHGQRCFGHIDGGDLRASLRHGFR